MRLTKLNHLLERRPANARCKNTNKQHCWVASGEVRATTGGHISVNLRCSVCGAHESTFLTSNEYQTQKKIINNSIQEQQEK
jgi:hypothetical protein